MATSLSKVQIQELVRKIATEEGVPPELVLSILETESDYDITAQSKLWKNEDGEVRGARGLMQLMPTLAVPYWDGIYDDKNRQLTIEGRQVTPEQIKAIWDTPSEIYDPEKNIRAGVRFIRDLTKRFPDIDGQVNPFVLAGYNAGETVILRRQREGVSDENILSSLTGETQQYVDKASGKLARLAQEGAPWDQAGWTGERLPSRATLQQPSPINIPTLPPSQLAQAETPSRVPFTPPGTLELPQPQRAPGVQTGPLVAETRAPQLPPGAQQQLTPLLLRELQQPAPQLAMTPMPGRSPIEPPFLRRSTAELQPTESPVVPQLASRVTPPPPAPGQAQQTPSEPRTYSETEQWAALGLQGRLESADTLGERAAVYEDIERAKTDPEYMQRMADVARHGKWSTGVPGAVKMGLGAATLLGAVGTAALSKGTAIPLATKMAGLGLTAMGIPTALEAVERRKQGLPWHMQALEAGLDVGIPGALGAGGALMRRLGGRAGAAAAPPGGPRAPGPRATPSPSPQTPAGQQAGYGHSFGLGRVPVRGATVERFAPRRAREAKRLADETRLDPRLESLPIPQRTSVAQQIDQLRRGNRAGRTRDSMGKTVTNPAIRVSDDVLQNQIDELVSDAVGGVTPPRGGPVPPVGASMRPVAGLGRYTPDHAEQVTRLRQTPLGASSPIPRAYDSNYQASLQRRQRASRVTPPLGATPATTQRNIANFGPLGIGLQGAGRTLSQIAQTRGFARAADRQGQLLKTYPRLQEVPQQQRHAAARHIDEIIEADKRRPATRVHKGRLIARTPDELTEHIDGVLDAYITPGPRPPLRRTVPGASAILRPVGRLGRLPDERYVGMRTAREADQAGKLYDDAGTELFTTPRTPVKRQSIHDRPLPAAKNLSKITRDTPTAMAAAEQQIFGGTAAGTAARAAGGVTPAAAPPPTAAAPTPTAAAPTPTPPPASPPPTAASPQVSTSPWGPGTRVTSEGKVEVFDEGLQGWRSLSRKEAQKRAGLRTPGVKQYEKEMADWGKERPPTGPPPASPAAQRTKTPAASPVAQQAETPTATKSVAEIEESLSELATYNKKKTAMSISIPFVARKLHSFRQTNPDDYRRIDWGASATKDPVRDEMLKGPEAFKAGQRIIHRQTLPPDPLSPEKGVLYEDAPEELTKAMRRHSMGEAETDVSLSNTVWTERDSQGRLIPSSPKAGLDYPAGEAVDEYANILEISRNDPEWTAATAQLEKKYPSDWPIITDNQKAAATAAEILKHRTELMLKWTKNVHFQKGGMGGVTQAKLLKKIHSLSHKIIKDSKYRYTWDDLQPGGADVGYGNRAPENFDELIKESQSILTVIMMLLGGSASALMGGSSLDATTT